MEDREYWKPFDVIEDKRGTTLRLHGEGGKRRKIEADKIPKIYEAMRKGWDIDIQYAIIDGIINISAAELETDDRGNYIIAGIVFFIETIFSQNANFIKARFNQDVSFVGTVFQGMSFFDANFNQDASFVSVEFNQGANFIGTIFDQNASFTAARFNQDASFVGGIFSQDASFTGSRFSDNALFMAARFNHSASFDEARFTFPGDFGWVSIVENTVWRGLWNYIVRPLISPIAWLFTFGKCNLPNATVTDIFSINTNTMMDSSRNPRLKRYIDDEQWIRSWRMNPRGRYWRKHVFRLWELTSHCGRSIGLWAFWSFFLAFLFSLVYMPAPDWMGDQWCAFWQEHGAELEQMAEAYKGSPVTFWSCLYFSIVSFTTLGFGDIATANWQARFLVTSEVILGYVMLGGLISIFANKFARRS